MIPQKLEQLIEPALADMGFELVRIRYTGGTGKSARGQLQIMAEPVDLREMTVEDCAAISRHISAVLDVEDVIKDAYQLEVSSPGMDRPLTRPKDFERFAGELVKITLKQMLEGQKRYRGRLVGMDEKGIIHIETSTGRVSAAFDEIDTAKIDPTEFFSTRKQPAKRVKPGTVKQEEA
jgi:ribosome maturation factor RimP